MTFGRTLRTVPRMDTIKILLGATVALLLGALLVSWNGFRKDVKNEPPAELAKIQQQIQEVREEQARLKKERERILFGDPAAPQAEDTAEEAITDPADVPEMAGAVFADEEVSMANADEAPAPELAPADPVAPPPVASDEARAELIKSAPAVAKVGEWVDDGGFAIVQVLDPAVVKSDAILCVRRNSGILGRLKIGEVTPEGAIANAVSQFAGPKPQPGDELIVEPQ